MKTREVSDKNSDVNMRNGTHHDTRCAFGCDSVEIEIAIMKRREPVLQILPEHFVIRCLLHNLCQLAVKVCVDRSPQRQWYPWRRSWAWRRLTAGGCFSRRYFKRHLPRGLGRARSQLCTHVMSD
jgi:hypothetical protein